MTCLGYIFFLLAVQHFLKENELLVYLELVTLNSLIELLVKEIFQIKWQRMRIELRLFRKILLNMVSSARDHILDVIQKLLMNGQYKCTQPVFLATPKLTETSLVKEK